MEEHTTLPQILYLYLNVLTSKGKAEGRGRDEKGEGEKGMREEGRWEREVDFPHLGIF